MKPALYAFAFLVLAILPVAAQILALEHRGVAWTGGDGSEGRISADIFRVSDEAYIAGMELYKGTGRHVPLDPGTYRIDSTVRVGGTVAGSSGSYTFTIAEGQLHHVTLYLDYITQTASFGARGFVTLPTTQATVPGMLFVLLAAGFFFGWSLFSPLDA